MTSFGEVNLSQVYFRCVACGDGGFAADLRLGIQIRYRVEAERLVCLAAASWSYDMPSDRLEEFCGLNIGDTTIREISQRCGAAMNARQNWSAASPIPTEIHDYNLSGIAVEPF